MVRVSFATNDERTARRVSDALGMATELRAMKNYAGHRLSPWLGHLMVSCQETARPLLTPGEAMQLPQDDELVLISGCPPIRAQKARYYEDRQLRERVLPPPAPGTGLVGNHPADDWSERPLPTGAPGPNERVQGKLDQPVDDPANGGIRREPELPEHEEVVPERAPPVPEFAFPDEEPDDEVQRASVLRRQAASVARQAAMDPGDGIDL
jgi:type IV secretion system protein VirD4